MARMTERITPRQSTSRPTRPLAGGFFFQQMDAPGWWVLADAEGNEACVATWLSSD